MPFGGTVFGTIKDYSLRQQERVLNAYHSRIREKAITRTKSRILLAGKKVEEFDPDALETIVKEEEDKVKSGLLQSAGLAVLVILGLS